MLTVGWQGLRALLLALALAGAAGAENPKVSLRLERVTASEAADQLARAAGSPVVIGESAVSLQRREPDPPALQRPETFDWRETTLAQAMRELCARYGLRPARLAAGGTMLVPAEGPMGQPVARPEAFERLGVRVQARGVWLSNYATADPQGGGGHSGNPRLSLQLGGVATGRDPDSIAGVRNIRFEDDRGGRVDQEPERVTVISTGPALFPDEWTAHAPLRGLNPAAERLRWVEGDLMVYSALKPLRIEVPVPGAGAKPAGRRAGDVTILVHPPEVLNRPAAAPRPELPLPPGFQTPLYGTVVPVQIYSAPNGPVVPRGEGTMGRSTGAWPPYAVGASGRLYPAQAYRRPGEARSPVGAGPQEARWIFATEETLERLVWVLVERGEPERLFTFRLTDLPLPPQGFIVQPLRAADAPPSPSLSDRPYHQSGGGSLVTGVRIAGETVKEGTLAVGLSTRRGAGWTPPQWVRVSIAADGAAVLRDLKPGTYRLLRVYHPSESGTLSLLPLGCWTNAEITIPITAGRRATAAPLEWRVGEDLPPAAGARPPAGRQERRP